MTRRGAVQLLAAVAGIVSTAMGQTVAKLIGKVTPTQAEYEACEKERSKKVAAMPPGAPWGYIGCEPPQSGPPYVCEIDAEVLTGIRVVSSKETIEITMAEVMAALREPAQCSHRFQKGIFYITVASSPEEPKYYAPSGITSVEFCEKCGVIRLPLIKK